MQIVDSDKLEIVPLGHQEDMIVVAKNHPLAKKKVFPINELKDYPYIGCSRGLDSYNYDLANRFDASLNQIMVVNNDYGCFAMISKGLGFGIHPKIMVKNSMFPVKGIPFDVETYTDITIGYNYRHEHYHATGDFPYRHGFSKQYHTVSTEGCKRQPSTVSQAW